MKKRIQLKWCVVGLFSMMPLSSFALHSLVIWLTNNSTVPVKFTCVGSDNSTVASKSVGGIIAAKGMGSCHMNLGTGNTVTTGVLQCAKSDTSSGSNSQINIINTIQNPVAKTSYSSSSAFINRANQAVSSSQRFVSCLDNNNQPVTVYLHKFSCRVSAHKCLGVNLTNSTSN